MQKLFPTSLVGVIISSMRKSTLLAGYGDYRQDIQKIATTLRLEMFRDGDDVVLTGNHKSKPMQIRFSYSETTPGLNIRRILPPLKPNTARIASTRTMALGRSSGLI